MSPEEVARAQLNAWATLDAEKILSYFSDEAVLVDSTGTYRGLGEVRSWVQGHVKRNDQTCSRRSGSVHPTASVTAIRGHLFRERRVNCEVGRV